MASDVNEEEATLPLTWTKSNEQASDEEDLDVDGVTSQENGRALQPSESTDTFYSKFANLWRRIPPACSIERNPSIALTQLLTLLGFLSLCIFVFSVPSLLHVLSPKAPTPPGTAPNLDEAASMISGEHAAVAADHPQCSALGVKVMEELNGNTVDAAIAAVLCQGVLAPFASGMGGGAIILIHDSQRGVSRVYDGREVAPAAASMEHFRNGSNAKSGGLSVAVPGELKALYVAHRDLGRIEWKTLVGSVVDIAKEAKVGKYLAIKLKETRETILKNDGLKAIFAKRVLTQKGEDQKRAEAAAEIPGARMVAVDKEKLGVLGSVKAGDGNESGGEAADGRDGSNSTYTLDVLEEGDRITNDALVKFLEQVGERGSDALYKDYAKRIGQEVQSAGGVMSEGDIRKYSVSTVEPIRSLYHGFMILGAPLPSAGGLSIAMALNMIGAFEFRRKGRNGVSYKLLVETLKWVFGARMSLGDPAFVGGAEREAWKMLSRREAMKRVFRVERSEKTFGPRHYSSRIGMSKLEGGTSHVSVLDINGTGVSITSSVNLAFGAGIVSSSTGMILNNQMDSFTTAKTRVNGFGMYPAEENKVEGGKRAVSSMSPTIVMRSGEIYMVAGGSGGPKAISGVLQTILNVVDFGDRLDDAISAPRVHHQLVPNHVGMEGANGTSCEEEHLLKRASSASGTGKLDWMYWKAVCNDLKGAGHKIEGPAAQGAVQAVVRPDVLRVGEVDGKIYAASDPRRIGRAAAF